MARSAAATVRALLISLAAGPLTSEVTAPAAIAQGILPGAHPHVRVAYKGLITMMIRSQAWAAICTMAGPPQTGIGMVAMSCSASLTVKTVGAWRMGCHLMCRLKGAHQHHLCLNRLFSVR